MGEATRACRAFGSKRRDLQLGYVVDAHRLRRVERLAVPAAYQRAVVRRVVTNQVVQRLAFWVTPSCLDCVTELRLVAADCLELLLESVADVDDESGLLIVLAVRER